MQDDTTHDADTNSLEVLVGTMNSKAFMTERLVQFVDGLLGMHFQDPERIIEAAERTGVGMASVGYMGASRFQALNTLLQTPPIVHDFSRFRDSQICFCTFLEWACVLEAHPESNVWCNGCLTFQGNQLAHSCLWEGAN